MKLPEKKVTIGATRTFGERSLIPVVESISFRRKDAFFGTINLKALIVIEGDDYYLLPLQKGVTFDEIRCQVPELQERIKQERLMRETQAKSLPPRNSPVHPRARFKE